VTAGEYLHLRVLKVPLARVHLEKAQKKRLPLPLKKKAKIQEKAREKKATKTSLRL
jgi:hypothetical protein